MEDGSSDVASAKSEIRGAFYHPWGSLSPCLSFCR